MSIRHLYVWLLFIYIPVEVIFLFQSDNFHR